MEESFLQLALFILIAFGIVRLLKTKNLFIDGKITWRWLVLAIAFKVIAGSYVSNYFDDRYEEKRFSDIHKYFNDGVRLAQVAKASPLLYLQILVGVESEESNKVLRDVKVQNWFAHTAEYAKTMAIEDGNFFNSQRSMIRLNSLFALASNGFLPTHILLFSVLGVLSTLLLTKVFVKHSNAPPLLIYSLLIFIPSALAWTSTIQKEVLILLGLSLVLKPIFSWFNSDQDSKRSITLEIVELVLGVFLLLLFAYHSLLVFSLSLAIAAIVYHWKKTSAKVIAGITVLGLLAMLYLPSPIDKAAHVISSRYNVEHKIGKGGYYLEHIENGKLFYFDFDEFESLKGNIASKRLNEINRFYLPAIIKAQGVTNGVVSKEKTAIASEDAWYYQKLRHVPANSFIDGKEINPNIPALIRHLPTALYNSFIAPLFYLDGFKSLLLIFESAVFLLLFYRASKKVFSGKSNFNHLLIYFFVLFSCLLIAYSTPVLGNILRHRSIAVILMTAVSIQTAKLNFFQFGVNRGS